MSSNGYNNNNIFGFANPDQDQNNAPSAGQEFTNTNTNTNTAPGPVFFGPPPPPPPQNEVFQGTTSTNDPSFFEQDENDEIYQNGNVIIIPSYLESPAIPQNPTFFGPPPPPHFSAVNAPPQQNFFHQPHAYPMAPPMANPMTQFIQGPQWNQPAWNGGQNMAWNGAQQTGHQATQHNPQQGIQNTAWNGFQNNLHQGPQNTSHQANSFLAGFGGLNIQGVHAPPGPQFSGGAMEVDPADEDLDFGNSDDDDDEDEDDDEDDDDDGGGDSELNLDGVDWDEFGRELGAVDGDSIADTDPGEMNNNDPDEVIEYDQEDSDWEEDPTGYQDPHITRAPVAIPTRADVSTNPLTALGIFPTPAQLAKSLKRPRAPSPTLPTSALLPTKKARIAPSNPSPFEALASHPELYFDLCLYLPPSSLLALYSTSRLFHATLNSHLTHALKQCARTYAPLASLICAHGMYANLCIPDPAGRRDPNNWAVVRQVPSFRWLAMVAHREKCARDILACLAREDHRLPADMRKTLLKIWVVMDVATTAGRICMLHNEGWWTDQDCWNAQAFVVKLGLRFNEPWTGVGDDGLVRIMLGQRGLTPLCRLLKREAFTQGVQVIRAAVRYCYEVKPSCRGLPIFGVPAEEVGKGHLEGWGKGKIHLFRIDELVMRESIRRRLRLDDHLLYMMLWGYVDPRTGRDIKPSDEEMYMSDTEDEERARGVRRRAAEKAKRARVRAERAQKRAMRRDGEGTKQETEYGYEQEEDTTEQKETRDKGKEKALPSDDDDTSDYSSSSSSFDEGNAINEWDGITFDADWETEDEDMAEASLFNDLRDAGAVGASGWRRKRGEEDDSESGGSQDGGEDGGDEEESMDEDGEDGDDVEWWE